MITRKKYLNLTGLLVALITGVLFLPGLSNAAITVEEVYDFGEVEVGTASRAILKVSSTNSTADISALILKENQCVFSIIPEASAYKDLPAEIIINYAPSSPDFCSSTLKIYISDRDNATVILSGTGFTTQKITIEGILSFFDTCVADGSLEGYVPDKSHNKRSAGKITESNESDKVAENRLNALRNMIERAGHLIDSGKIDEGCGQLEAAYKKMDGLNTPGDSIDFVEGSKVSHLADDVQDLMGTLECK